MDPYKFVQVASGNSILKSNRLLSNWVVQRARELNDGRFVRIHRISTKRVLIEVSSLCRSHKWKFAIAAAALVAVICTLFGFITLTSPHSTVAKPSASIAQTAQPRVCELGALLLAEVHDLAAFNSGAWSFQATGAIDKLGGLASVRGVAACDLQTLEITLLAKKLESGWQLKQMVPIN